MSDSEIKRNPEGWTLDFNAKPKWECTHGLIMMSMDRVWKDTGDDKYYDYIRTFVDFMIDENGVIKTYKQSDYNIDRVNGGKFLIDLYQATGEEKFKLALEQLRDQMREHPRNSENGFWHKKVYPHQINSSVHPRPSVAKKPPRLRKPAFRKARHFPDFYLRTGKRNLKPTIFNLKSTIFNLQSKIYPVSIRVHPWQKNLRASASPRAFLQGGTEI
ncbi:glycoside hydrolase family 88 protein [Belliella aquatica]